jgi:hypothetical protein
MAGLTLFFKTAEEFYTWARKNIPEFISNGGTGAINNDISTVRSFSEANLTTAKGRFSIAQGVAQFINTERDLEQLIHYYNGDSNLASKVGKNSALWEGDVIYIKSRSRIPSQASRTDSAETKTRYSDFPSTQGEIL